MKRLFAAVGLFSLAVGVAVGGPAPTPVPSSTPSATELVARLGSEDFHQREAATAALEKAGSGAIPALREALKSEKPEVRQRAGLILVKLQRAADSGKRLAPRKIALSYKNMPLGNAINDFRVRTGLNIAIDPNHISDPFRKVTCATGELPIWEAFDAFCAAAGLKEEFQPELDVPKNANRGRGYIMGPPQVPGSDAVPITLVDGKRSRIPGDRRTAIRVLALPSSFPGHRVTLGNGEITFCFDITPAPGLNWQDVSAVKITKLIDDAGRFGGAGSMRPAEGGDDLMEWGGFGGRVVVFGGPGMGGGGMRFDPRTGQPIYPNTVPNPRIIPVPLKIATPTARRIKRLEGTVFGEITLPSQTLITVNDPVKHTGSAFNGPGEVRLTVQSITAGDNGTTVQFVLQYPSPWSIGARRGWNPGGLWPEAPRAGNQTPTVHMLNAAGKPMASYTSNGFTSPSDDGQTMQQNMTLNYRKDSGTPAKIIVTGPRPLVVEVPFVLENVPLP